MAQHIFACTVLVISVVLFYNEGVAAAGIASVRRSFSVDLDKKPACNANGCNDTTSNNKTVCSACPQLISGDSGNQTLERVKRETHEDPFDVFRMLMVPMRRASVVKKKGKQKVAASGNAVAVSMKGKKALRAKGWKGTRSKKTKRGAGNGMAVAAVGDSEAMSYDGSSLLHKKGRGKPWVATSGNGAAYASDGHSAVSSKHGKTHKTGRSHANRMSEEIMAANGDFLKSLKKQNQDKVTSIMSKSHPRGSAAFAGSGNDRDDAANFNPFKFVGMKDPREMLG